MLWVFALLIGLIRGIPFDSLHLSTFGLTRDTIAVGQGALPPYVSFLAPVPIIAYELLVCLYYACAYYGVVLFACALTLRFKNSYIPLGVISFLALIQTALKEALTDVRRDLTWVGTLFESSHRSEMQYGSSGTFTPWWLSVALVGTVILFSLVVAYCTDPYLRLFKKRKWI
jgi:hypothetical protein